MEHEAKYFTLTLDSLRAIGGWTADCSERALAVYELQAPSDPRPRAARAGIRQFADGGKRAAQLRSLAMAAHAAAREVDDPAAVAAARGRPGGGKRLHPSLARCPANQTHCRSRGLCRPSAGTPPPWRSDHR